MNISSNLLNLREKISELEWKSKAYDELQNELSKTRQELINKNTMLEDHKRKINDLKMQLQSANQVIEWIEKEKAQNMNEKIQLQINFDTTLKERESLLRQTQEAKLENVSLKLKVDKLTETISVTEAKKKIFELSYKETQERFMKVKNIVENNVVQLEKEHNLLLKSVESVTQLNKTLQATIQNAHAAYIKKNEEVQVIQKQLISNAQINTQPFIEYDENFCFFKSKFDPRILLEEVHNDFKKYDQKYDEEKLELRF